MSSSDDHAPADAQLSQLWLPPPEAQTTARVPRVILIGSERIELPQRLDDDYVLRPKLGEGNFGVVLKCVLRACLPCDRCNCREQTGSAWHVGARDQ